jgi:hypothetical protein
VSGLVSPLGLLSLGVVLPLLGTAEASISGSVNLSLPTIAGKLAAAVRLNLALTAALPTANVQAEAQAALAVAGRLAARIAAGITAPSIGLRATANVALMVELTAILGALNAQLSFAVGLGTLALNAGIAAYAYAGNADSMGSAFGVATSDGIAGGQPTDHVNALLLATSSAATWSAMGQVLKVG